MLSRIYRAVARRIAARRYRPDIEVRESGGLLRLGSDYGGWTFEPSADLQNCTIVSCGLGEDASFDVEFAARFRASVILVDPTPRAIAHYRQIQASIGQRATRGYQSGGTQPIAAYDLSSLQPGSLVLEASAIWIENTTLKFFAPRNPAHVSHSIVNFQNDYSMSGEHIEVPSITPEGLVQKYGLGSLSLMKLDIEGAEVKVIEHALKHSIRPRQILLEFDEMTVPSPASKAHAELVDRLLRDAGYVCRYFDRRSNFLYIRESGADGPE